MNLTKNPYLNQQPTFNQKRIALLSDLKKLWALWRKSNEKRKKDQVMYRIKQTQALLEKLEEKRKT